MDKTPINSESLLLPLSAPDSRSPCFSFLRIVHNVLYNHGSVHHVFRCISAILLFVFTFLIDVILFNTLHFAVYLTSSEQRLRSLCRHFSVGMSI